MNSTVNIWYNHIAFAIHSPIYDIHTKLSPPLFSLSLSLFDLVQAMTVGKE
jgi:hypothetical protein